MMNSQHVSLHDNDEGCRMTKTSQRWVLSMRDTAEQRHVDDNEGCRWLTMSQWREPPHDDDVSITWGIDNGHGRTMMKASTWRWLVLSTRATMNNDVSRTTSQRHELPHDDDESTTWDVNDGHGRTRMRVATWWQWIISIHHRMMMTWDIDDGSGRTIMRAAAWRRRVWHVPPHDDDKSTTRDVDDHHGRMTTRAVAWQQCVDDVGWWWSLMLLKMNPHLKQLGRSMREGPYLARQLSEEFALGMKII